MSSYEKRNLLLRSLPTHIAEEICTAGRVVPLELREQLTRPGSPQNYVYFPETGAISLFIPMDDGSLVEIATIGYEGMVGLSQVYGVSSVADICLCPIAGSALRLESDRFLSLVEQYPELKLLCERYSMTLFNQVARILGCNRTHSVEQRCASWLLLAYERSNYLPFVLTQEYLALLLGVSRTGINQAAGNLSKARLISYVRGRINVLDVKGLEKVCCGCYSSVRQYYKTVMQPTPISNPGSHLRLI